MGAKDHGQKNNAKPRKQLQDKVALGNGKNSLQWLTFKWLDRSMPQTITR